MSEVSNLEDGIKLLLFNLWLFKLSMASMIFVSNYAVYSLQYLMKYISSQFVRIDISD